MADEIFFDTSIIVYAYDETEVEKRPICEEIVRNCFEGKFVGVISNQILSELFFVLTTKKGVSKDDAQTIVDSLIKSENWIKVNYKVDTVKKSIVASKTINVLFWDILVAETMKENGINKIYTEDEDNFKKIPGIKTINPFK